MNEFDTDSVFINVGKFIETNIGFDSWNKISDEDKIKYINKISPIIEEYVNNKVYREVQRKHYNSTETEFRIKFKQEIIAKSILFVKKKKYSSWNVSEEGVPTDKIKTTGLEIVRSDTPEHVRPMLKDIMTMILKGSTDKEISDKIHKCKKELQNIKPEAIATNIGIHDTKKYISADGTFLKGTPMHVKGVGNYRKLLKILSLDKTYEDIMEGAKAKVVYVKKNAFGFESITFNRWPKEFDSVLQIDYPKQIDKTFLNKCDMLLEVLGKKHLITSNDAQRSLNTFFIT